MLVLLDWSLSFVKSKIAIMLGILILYTYFSCAGWVNAETILLQTESTPNEFLKFLHGHPNTCSARSERISLLSEPTRYKFIADQKNNCIAGWVNGEIRIEHFSEYNFTGLDQSFHRIQPARLSSEQGIYELLATPIHAAILTANFMWAPYHAQQAIFSS